jgi:hypothetical protein
MLRRIAIGAALAIVFLLAPGQAAAQERHVYIEVWYFDAPFPFGNHIGTWVQDPCNGDPGPATRSWGSYSEYMLTVDRHDCGDVPDYTYRPVKDPGTPVDCRMEYVCDLQADGYTYYCWTKMTCPDPSKPLWP